MKRQFLITCTFVAVCMSLFNTAQAAESSNVYAGGGLGMTNAGWVGENTTGVGFDGKTGYQFNRIWSVEGVFTHFANTTGAVSSISTNAISIMGKASLPIGNSKFRVFSGLGLGNLFNSGGSTASHIGYVMAYGVSLPLSENLTLTGSYTLFKGHYTSTANGTNTVPNATYYNLDVIYLLPESLFQ